MREYDIALSFAGEDREYVEEIANKLKAKGIKVFYDKFETSKLWGKDLYQYLSDMYQNRAEYCVIFISQYYIEKAWTKHELKSAQNRAFLENREYILPIRMDETKIPGLNETIGFIYRNNFTTDEVVRLLQDKLISYNIFLQCKDLKEIYKVAISEIYKVSKAELNQICLEALFNQHSTRLFVFTDIILDKKFRYNIVSMDGVIGKAFKTGKIIYISDVLKCDFFINSEMNTRSELAIPIKVHGNIIGVINSESLIKDYFDKDKIDKLSMITEHLGKKLEEMEYSLNYFSALPVVYNEI